VVECLVSAFPRRIVQAMPLVEDMRGGMVDHSVTWTRYHLQRTVCGDWSPAGLLATDLKRARDCDYSLKTQHCTNTDYITLTG